MQSYMKRLLNDNTAQKNTSSQKNDTKHKNTSTPIQRFRWVKPENITYGKRDQASMFSSHKIEHYKTDNKEAEPFNFQAPQALEVEGVLGEVSDENTHINLDVLTSITNAGNAITPDSNAEAWKAFFLHQAKTSDPQTPNNKLGTNVYNPTITTVDGLTESNARSATSKFHVKPLTMNVKMPMLVSENDEFAINGLHSEPKEGYLTDGCALTLNNNLKEVGNNRIELQKYSNSVMINGKQLSMYRPKFTKGASESYEEAITHACDTFRTEYYKEGPDKEKVSTELLNSVSKSPWNHHYAGILCSDGADTLSLENGARNAWLTLRGDNGEEVEFNDDDDDLFDHVYDLDQAIKKNNALQEQLNKTWYFRIYGTEDKGQNLNEQIKARFQ